jgi:hypothetical protein
MPARNKLWALNFAQSEGQIRKCRTEYGHLVVELRNFLTGSTSTRWEGGKSKFYAELEVVYPAFAPSILNTRRMEAAKAARDVVSALVQREVRLVNMLIGVGNSLSPIDVRFRLTRLISQMHLQKLSGSAELAEKIAAVSAMIAKAPVKNSKVVSSVTNSIAIVDLSRNVRRGFVRQCSVHFIECLSGRDRDRQPLLERLELQVRVLDPAVDVTRGRAKGWKQCAAQAFANCISALFGQWRDRPKDLASLVSHGPGALLSCFSRKQDGEKQFFLDKDKVQLLLRKAPPEGRPAKLESEPAKAEKNNGRPPNGFCFVPQKPVVKTVFEAKMSIGMFLISGTVASEIIVSAARQVVNAENVARIGLSEAVVASDMPQQVIRMALLASFDRQRSSFGSGVAGARADFMLGLDRMFERTRDSSFYQCMDHIACADEGMSKSASRFCFPYLIISEYLQSLTLGRCARGVMGEV